ncbi:MAG TPA: hypothetical protein VFV67_20805 [Actinophytocola sp.]|uniref:hypothetical protein n=1 Tax=Actinophytocola sp. TaxID=1872138 RepID=UPI002DBD8E11|nr:hypothetical protein [Actinophytocola sp.]HEU5473094.1 hypothetical protein [Actinophytocola sp.]
MFDQARSETERAVCTAVGSGIRLDLAGRPDRTVRAELLAALLIAGGQPAVRLDHAVVTGTLDLEGRVLDTVLTLRRCTFEQPPRLMRARLIGLSLRGSRLPGLRARNLRVDSDLVLEAGFTSTGPVDLTDATVAGTVRLAGAVLRRPGGAALLAARLRVAGSVSATALRAEGEVRLRGADIGGSVQLTGARLVHPTGHALEAAGLVVAGSLRCDAHGGRFDVAGRVVLAGARIGGDVVFSGARLHDPTDEGGQVSVVPHGSVEGEFVLDAARLKADGDLKLDEGFVAAGAVGLRSARIGGHLLLADATIGRPEVVPALSASFAAGRPVDRVPVALVADGVEVGGDVEARGRAGLHAYGQVRLADAIVHGSVSLSTVRVHGPAVDALFADRLRVGGTLFLRRVRISGSVRLQNAHIGSSLDCSGARLRKPRLRPNGSVKPSLDARAATIGKDLLCGGGFRAAGGVRVRSVEVGKLATFAGARLGGRTGPGHPVPAVALSAYGLTAAELVLTFPSGRPPRGRVVLTRARVVSIVDGSGLYASTGGVDLEDFGYTAIAAAPEVDVRTRLGWLRAVQPDFAPGAYEQLAGTYRAGGDEERARQVQIERQRRRFAELPWPGRMWGRLQEWTVGYGYRPWLAIVWLAVFWLLGTIWFTFHEAQRLDPGTQPVWNPALLATDLVLPIVDLGQDKQWQLTGASQWISAVLIAAGWVLATTAAAGATRVLRRG